MASHVRKQRKLCASRLNWYSRALHSLRGCTAWLKQRSGKSPARKWFHHRLTMLLKRFDTYPVYVCSDENPTRLHPKKNRTAISIHCRSLRLIFQDNKFTTYEQVRCRARLQISSGGLDIGYARCPDVRMSPRGVANARTDMFRSQSNALSFCTVGGSHRTHGGGCKKYELTLFSGLPSHGWEIWHPPPKVMCKPTQ